MCAKVIDNSIEMKCLVPFPDGSDSFVNGFEAGIIWAKMENEEEKIGDFGDNEIGLPYHSSNIDVFRRMAAAKGYDIEVEPTKYSEWIMVTFIKRRPQLTVVFSRT